MVHKLVISCIHENMILIIELYHMYVVVVALNLFLCS
jgi:hypothetical protein